MPRGYLRNISNSSRKQKRGGGSTLWGDRTPRKKVKNQSKCQTTRQTSNLINDDQRYLRFSKKVRHTTDFTFDDDICLSEEKLNLDYDEELQNFYEMNDEKEREELNAEIEYNQNLCLDIDVSSSNSKYFIDHILKICLNPKLLQLTHKQVGNCPPQGHIVFTSKHKYKVKKMKMFGENYGKRIFRKVYMVGYSCDGCGRE
jgi:hypothetical protein